MPIEMKDSDNGLGLIVTGRKIIMENEYLDSYKNQLSQDRGNYKKYRYSLHDWSEVTDVEVSSDAIGQIAELCRDFATINPNFIVAHVATLDITYGLSRMWEVLSDETNWEIMVFRHRKDAEAWIRQQVKEKYEICDLSFS